MSFFKKIAASVGIGAAQVETVLEKSQYRPGDVVTGVVHVRGGKVEQEIDDIDLYVMTRYVVEKHDQKIMQEATVTSHRVVNRFTILPNEQKQFTFSFRLPLDMPVTIGKVGVWVKTDVDIRHGFDAGDHDQIQIHPHPWMENVLQAVGQIGFRLREADCEYAPFFKRRLPFVQEFEFVPDTPAYRGKLDELEVVFHLEENGMEVALEIDRKARGVLGWLEEKYGLDERLVRLYFTADELNGGKGAIAEKIREAIRIHGR